MKEKYLLIVAFIIFMPGCDSGVEMEDLLVDNLVSVTSVISPQDTLLVAYLYSAQPLGQIAFEDSALIKDAQVIIHDGKAGDTLSYNALSKRYEAERNYLNIVPSGEYFLSIKTKEGSTIQGSCIIPSSPEMPKISGEYQGDDYYFEVEWRNPSNHRFYTFFALGNGFYESDVYDELDPQFAPRYLQIDAQLTDDTLYPSDGQQENNSVRGIVYSAKIADNPTLLITLRNIDEPLYNYLDTYRDYSDWAANNEGSLFPNFQDFRPIYSNIENGLGVFAGSNQVTKKIQL